MSAILLLTAFSARAGHMTFAVPSSSGRISLGVIDERGRIVRTLRQLTPVSDFRFDLNGLSLEWDMLDDDGGPLPPGRYELTGWFVPDGVEVVGAALHFNDWVDEGGGLPMGLPVAVAAAVGDAFWIVGESEASGALKAWNAEPGGIKGDAIPVSGRLLAGSDGLFASIPPEGGLFLTTPSGSSTNVFPNRKILAASFADSGLAVLESLPGGRTRALVENTEGFAELPETPAPARLIAQTQNHAYVADEQRVWRLDGAGQWQPFSLGDSMKIHALAAGPQDSLWVSSALPGDPPLHVIRQYAPDGNLLRELDVAAPAKIAADSMRLRIFLLTRENGAVRVRGLQPMTSEAPALPDSEGSAVADWDLFLDKVVDPEGAAAFWSGNPGAGMVPHGFGPHVSIGLSPNSFDATPGPVELTAVVSEGSVWLTDARGLRIVEICELPDVHRTALSHGLTPETINAYVGSTGGIAEFTIHGLQNLVRLEPGSFETKE
jgi:hypothetical protein